MSLGQKKINIKYKKKVKKSGDDYDYCYRDQE